MSPDGLISKRLLLSEIRGQRKRFHIFAVSVAAVFIAGDCSRGPAVEAVLCKRVSAAFEPVEPTTRFNKKAERVYCAWAVKNTRGPIAVRGVWFAEDVGKAAPTNYRIDEKTVDLEGDSRGSFDLRRPDNGWPPGRYRLEIFLDARKAQEIRFAIE
jgi:hypothetical protein